MRVALPKNAAHRAACGVPERRAEYLSVEQRFAACRAPEWSKGVKLSAKGAGVGVGRGSGGLGLPQESFSFENA